MNGGFFLDVKQQKLSWLEDIKKDFEAKAFLYNVIFYQILLLFKFLKFSYVLL